MDGDGVLLAGLVDELAGGLEEGDGLHVADRTAHLDDGDVDVGVLAGGEDASLDLVGDVGDDLDGPAQVAPFAFLVDDGLVDLSRRDRVGLG